jgi:glycine oxidase
MTRYSEPQGTFDLLIAGQGLAGSAIALEALRQGLSVAVADPSPSPGASASRVAAGLVTPLTGKKINPGWRLAELLPAARSFYAWAAGLLGRAFFDGQEIIRWFADAEERRSFLARLDEPRIASWVAGLVDPQATPATGHGGFRMAGGGWLNAPAWLDAVRDFLANRDAWFERAVAEDEVEFSADGLRWGDLRAGHLVLCNGLAAAASRHFPGLPFRPAAGEVLEVEFDGPPPAEIWNRGGKWLAPREGGRRLCGATYRFGDWQPGVTAAGTAELLAVARAFTDRPLRSATALSGVRPILSQSRPVAGFHPGLPRLALLNGLGSKGALTAPWAARQLVAAIRGAAPLDPELDLACFPRWPSPPRP